MWGDGGAYAVWTAFLRRWRSDLRTGAAPELPELAPEHFAPETWSRLAGHLVDALSERLGLWASALTTDLVAADTDFGVGRAMVNSRTGLAGILVLTSHPSLPADLREKLRGLVEQQVRSAQQALEEQVDRMAQQGTPRAQVEQRRRTVRDNALTAALSSPPTPDPPPGDPWARDLTQRAPRRLALD